ALFRSLGDERILEFFVLFLREHLFREQVAFAFPWPALDDFLSSRFLDSDGDNIRFRRRVDIHHRWLIDGFDRRSRHLFRLSAARNCSYKSKHMDPDQISTLHVSPSVVGLD